MAYITHTVHSTIVNRDDAFLPPSVFALGADTVAPNDDVRVLGVTTSSDVSLEKHVTNISGRSTDVIYRSPPMHRYSVFRTRQHDSSKVFVHEIT